MKKKFIYFEISNTNLSLASIYCLKTLIINDRENYNLLATTCDNEKIFNADEIIEKYTYFKKKSCNKTYSLIISLPFLETKSPDEQCLYLFQWLLKLSPCLTQKYIITTYSLFDKTASLDKVYRKEITFFNRPSPTKIILNLLYFLGPLSLSLMTIFFIWSYISQAQVIVTQNYKAYETHYASLASAVKTYYSDSSDIISDYTYLKEWHKASTKPLTNPSQICSLMTSLPSRKGWLNTCEVINHTESNGKHYECSFHGICSNRSVLTEFLRSLEDKSALQWCITKLIPTPEPSFLSFIIKTKSAPKKHNRPKND